MENKNLIRVLITITLIILKINMEAKTRDEVIEEGFQYVNFGWRVVSSSNILDIYTYNDDGSSEYKPDNIDDRAQAHYDSQRKIWLYSKNGNRNWWPFEVGGTYTGEAYAWGLWDSVNEFSGKINSGEKWIAGRREEDLLPAGYRGFGGIDCSGFVSRVWGLGGYYYSGKLPSFSIMINKDKIKAGDILNKVGVHSIIFKEWISTENMTAKVIHATGWSIKNPTHMRRVVMDELQMAQKEDGNIYIYWPTTKKEEPYDNWHLYNFYSAFPQFEWSGSSMNVVKLI